ncbi:MAG TPA: ABC transporter ATP-binding protein/permease [Candidatus Acetatifactor stercoripullorum]|uniref:ABC transporter ATP-binding protein/permease n=1 Tax=Candidatus Acetatifactor stercoripullorum TaxID=2838414 RepID=A0A9D1R2F0_9FIRM|nr:ABC transporter ATP-binding protein [uncultured Acetatifactor sp.]HIW80044.1 ABC transporter ATP-binding protein/permease [Candidatus Acetatifactor stercoripullorum]
MKQIVIRYLKPYCPRMGVGFLIKFWGTIMDLCIPYILAYIIDSVIPKQQKSLVLLWGFFMIFCSVLAVTFNIIANRMASKVASDATELIRHDLFSNIMYLSNRQTDFFTKPSLISRMTTDTYNLHQMIGRVQRLGVRAPILLIGGICVTFTLDPAMACVLVAVLPLLGIITVYVSRKSIPMYIVLQEASDRFVRMVREDIAGIRVIKALSKTDYETEKFRAINKEVVERERKSGMVMAIIDPAMNILLNLGLVCVIFVGALRVNGGNCEVGKILAFTTYFTIILNAMLSISKMFTILSKAIASGNRIWQVLETKEDMQVLEMKEDQQTSKAKEDIQTPEEIVFEHVSFSYLKQKDADIRDLSFRIKRGETLGIIGEIGSGKSTIINLMMRMYDADQGRILISGRDVRTYKPEELKSRFGVVFQNDTIFEDTIAGNVTLGRELDETQVQEALLYARAREFVEDRTDREEEALNIKGANLSGGQKQRVLIARALAAKPRILILDDSSSALDYKTDAALRKGIREHFAGTTLVIVAQRISSILNADHILVMEDGKAIGYGTHEELLRSCAVYREIGKSQMGEEVTAGV